MTKSDAGRIGGTVTLERYGRNQLAEWGKLGGRPRSPTYQDILSRRQLLGQNNNDHKQKEVITGPPGNLKGLKKQYAEHCRSSGDGEIQEAVAPATTRGQLPERKAA